MKTLFVFFMMLCTISAFAATESGEYKGTLSVTVDTDPAQESVQSVTVSDDGTNVTLNIPNFKFPGFFLPLTINLKATKATDGTLTLVSINVSGIPIDDAYFEGSLKDGHCSIGMAITALSHDVLVLFEGDK